jgi:hypothetical protein
MKLLLEAQHRLLQATNPEAFKELLQREEAERVAKAKNGLTKVLSVSKRLAKWRIAIVTERLKRAEEMLFVKT